MTKAEKIRRFLDKGLKPMEIVNKGFSVAQVYTESKARKTQGAKPVVNVKRGRPPKAKPVTDLVNSPPHYKTGGIETIDFIEAKQLGYNLGNVVKYITRADHKGNKVQDLEKAAWYLAREISRTKG